MTLDQLRQAYEAAHKRATDAKDQIDQADAKADLDALGVEFDEAIAEVERTKKNLETRARQERTLAEEPDAPTPDDDDGEGEKHRHAAPRGQKRAEATYRPDNTGPSFFRDLVAAKSGDQAAFERLERNNREFAEARDVQKRAGLSQTATAAGEFIPPVWMIDQYAAKLRAGRPTVNAITTSPLPAGTNSLSVPAITTGASAAVQTDGNAVSNTDWVTTSYTAQVQTIAGRSVASYQFVDLGTAGVEGIIFEDLISAYNQALDVGVISGAVTNAKGLLNVTGINAPVYTDSSPTLAEFYPAHFKGKSLIESLAFVSPNFVVIHPSVWNNFLAGLDGTNGRPYALATDMAAFNAIAGYDWAAEGLVGNIAGLPVISDSNIPKNLGGGTETAAIMLNRRGFDIWESTPSFRVADQTSIATLSYQFVLWGYYGVMSRQPKMISAIGGTGLIPVAGY